MLMKLTAGQHWLSVISAYHLPIQSSIEDFHQKIYISFHLTIETKSFYFDLRFETQKKETRDSERDRLS